MLELLMTTNLKLPDNGIWKRLASAPEPGYSGKMFGDGDYIYYLTASTNPATTVNSFWRYTISTDTWTKLKCPIPYGINRTCTVIDGKAYFLGKYPLATQAWSYTIATDTWDTLPASSNAYYYGAAIAMGSKIYVYGGISDTTPFNTLRSYDPNTGLYTTLENGPVATYGAYIFKTSEDTFIVANGRNQWGETLVWMAEYTVSTNRWRTIYLTNTAALKTTFGANGTWGGFNYVFYGQDYNLYSSDKWKFRTSDFTAVKTPSPEPGVRSEPASCMHDGNFYIYGGRTATGATSSLSDFWRYTLPV